uniref:Uncharacterized protein n=1 Tax=Clastoptera arizonana TaxID=38151 RepID=A0A1B6CK42_9HEMI
MLGPIEDPQIKIRVPKSESDILKDALKGKEDVPEKFKKLILDQNEDIVLTVEDIKWLKSNLKLKTPLHELLSTWVLDLPQPSVIPRNPELEARIQRLKLEQLERDYQSMTKNVDNFRSLLPDDSIGSQSLYIFNSNKY